MGLRLLKRGLFWNSRKDKGEFLVRYQAPRGTQDIVPNERPYWDCITRRSEEIARTFGYRRIETPLFERAELFERGVGSGTDIVEKETYTFNDRGGERLTLRPEGTAPVCRAYLEGGMYTLPQPVRLYYFCPIFRYERPQAGRYRQHHQFGVEAIGDADPMLDAEVIELGWRFLTNGLGLENLVLQINTIGCPNCRPLYLDMLRTHYFPSVTAEQVCPECRIRFQHNLLRTLDCKRIDFVCQSLADTAPAPSEHLCSDCASHWATLKNYLNVLNIPFQVINRLVRGLDYYTRTVFEIQPRNVIGSQNTILAGGRYDGLIEEIGGKPTPAVGFGCGLERLILNMKQQKIPIPKELYLDAMVISLDDTVQEISVNLASELRSQGLKVIIAPSVKSSRGQMRQAASSKASYALLLGQDELSRGTVQVKNMDNGEQTEIKMRDVFEFISQG